MAPRPAAGDEGHATQSSVRSHFSEHSSTRTIPHHSLTPIILSSSSPRQSCEHALEREADKVRLETVAEHGEPRGSKSAPTPTAAGRARPTGLQRLRKALSDGWSSAWPQSWLPNFSRGLSVLALSPRSKKYSQHDDKRRHSDPSPMEKHDKKFRLGEPILLAPARGSTQSLPQKLAFRDQLAVLRQRVRQGRVLDPNSSFMRFWDQLMIVLLLFTGTWTPYEVGLLPTKLDVYFGINRFVDVAFWAHIAINFNLMYKSPHGWVYDRKKIAHRYLSSWFTIDLLSVIPFDIALLVLDLRDEVKVLRLFKLLRLLKLARLLRAQRLLQRWEAKSGLSYQSIALWKFVLLTVFSGHWMACTWAFLARYDKGEEDDVTWLVALLEDKPEPHIAAAWQIYLVSLYWSFMTLTSIGYGDIVPFTYIEYGVCVVCMLIGGMIWAYIIGNAVNIITNIDIHTHEYQRTMDDLNDMMRDRRLEPNLQVRLRTYFQNAHHLQRLISHRTLIDKMSPQLQGEVALAANKPWLQKVSWLRDCTNNQFVVEIAKSLQPLAYGPEEVLDMAATLYIVQRGLAARRGKIMSVGSVWGEDLILSEWELMDRHAAIALTYVEVLFLPRDELGNILLDFPEEAARIRKFQIRLALRRTFIAIANDEPYGTRFLLNAGLPPMQPRKPADRQTAKKEDVSDEGGKEGMDHVVGNAVTSSAAAIANSTSEAEVVSATSAEDKRQPAPSSPKGSRRLTVVVPEKPPEAKGGSPPGSPQSVKSWGGDDKSPRHSLTSPPGEKAGVFVRHRHRPPMSAGTQDLAAILSQARGSPPPPQSGPLSKPASMRRGSTFVDRSPRRQSGSHSYVALESIVSPRYQPQPVAPTPPLDASGGDAPHGEETLKREIVDTIDELIASRLTALIKSMEAVKHLREMREQHGDTAQASSLPTLPLTPHQRARAAGEEGAPTGRTERRRRSSMFSTLSGPLVQLHPLEALHTANVPSTGQQQQSEAERHAALLDELQRQQALINQWQGHHSIERAIEPGTSASGEIA
ncbi:unnamed protein product [Vitrella brassicaformis CCMP3155]|uniref:Ion transport domain-containing protein n=2 Tax=Vitrella brassicaformis TaxID=1169539 RepID=A0A0G4EBQ7_VITBC|nr:unnamed protein product [Vitrella brassicaformis CCMP3155]|eukprot:CEL92732.1 unnamed protein product [Vitrella brassicaformis CCMP3155]